MSQQVIDPFIWEGDEWIFLGADNVYDLFNPEAFGLKPEAPHTACWKGFVVTFETESSELYLKELLVNTEDDVYPDINGIKAIDDKMSFHAYKDLDIKLNQSGTIIVGREFKEEFIGRIDKIVQLNELSEEVLENILTSSRKSKFKMYVNCLKNDGITTKYTKKNISAFAKKAKKEGQDTGARELANVINYVFDKIMYEVMSKPKGTYTKLILQEGIEEDNTKYTLK